jgi:hypothetical protein
MPIAGIDTPIPIPIPMGPRGLAATGVRTCPGLGLAGVVAFDEEFGENIMACLLLFLNVKFLLSRYCLPLGLETLDLYR